MTKPIEVRIDRAAPKKFLVTKVYPGIGNTAVVAEAFPTFKAAIDWCAQFLPGVPRIRGW